MVMIRKAEDRGRTDLGWLLSRHTFSFSDYYDPAHMGFRSLRVINDDTVAPGKGFGTHPHRDMEIISYVLSGALEHKDSMGNGGVIHPGEFQYMAAGTGIQHSEFNPSSGEPVHFLQIWIQPNQQGVNPRYADLSFSEASPGVPHLVASPSGAEGSFRIHQDAHLYLIRFAGTESWRHKLAADRHAWVHVAEGEIALNGLPLRGGDGAAVSEEQHVNLEGDGNAQVLMFDLS